MRNFRLLLVTSLSLVLASCADLPADDVAYTGTLTGTIQAISSDRSSVRVSDTQLWLTRSTDAITPASIPVTKVMLKSKAVTLENLKVGQKVRIKAKAGFAIEILLGVIDK